jgi:hypothetical protein
MNNGNGKVLLGHPRRRDNKKTPRSFGPVVIVVALPASGQAWRFAWCEP